MFLLSRWERIKVRAKEWAWERIKVKEITSDGRFASARAEL